MHAFQKDVYASQTSETSSYINLWIWVRSKSRLNITNNVSKAHLNIVRVPTRIQAKNYNMVKLFRNNVKSDELINHMYFPKQHLTMVNFLPRLKDSGAILQTDAEKNYGGISKENENKSKLIYTIRKRLFHVQ